MSGGELFEQIKMKGSFSERDARDVLRQLLLGVEYLHEKGIAHRDLKVLFFILLFFILLLFIIIIMLLLKLKFYYYYYYYYLINNK